MFSVSRTIGIDDSCRVFSRTPSGDIMLFVAHGRCCTIVARLGAAAEPLLRAMALVVHASLALAVAAERPLVFPSRGAFGGRFRRGYGKSLENSEWKTQRPRATCVPNR